VAVNGVLALRAVTEEFVRLYPGEAARVLEYGQTGEAVLLLEREQPSRAAAVIERLNSHMAGIVLERLSEQALRRIVPAMDPARAAPLLARIDEYARERILALIEDRLDRQLRELMRYEPNRAGALMDPRVSSFRSGTTADEALKALRKLKDFGDVFVVSEDNKLLGRVALNELAVASPQDRLDELLRPTAVVHAFATREDVVEVLNETRLPSLPVVDINERLLGVIRHRALVAAAEQEASADIQTMVGVSKDERALSRVTFAVRQRLPWLQINLATAFLAAAVVGLFEDTISRFTALAVLMPIAAGQSGNTGAQAQAVTLRGITLREVRLSHWGTLALKELRVGLINGTAVGVTTAAGAYVWSQSLGLALVIGVAMVISMAIAGLAGCSVPLILKALGQDPAQSSSIVLTTVTDIAGFLSFLGLATLFSGIL
jgi:magnesium transporter